MLEIDTHDVGPGGAGSPWTPPGSPPQTFIASNRALEWQDTANSSAIMMSDRAISDSGAAGNAVAGDINYHSVWTEVGSEEWTGAVQRNDGSTEFG